MPPSHLLFVSLLTQRCLLPVPAAMVKWTRRWKPIWIPYGSSFQKAHVEEWEQEVHTSDDPGQECGHRWQDPSTCLGVPTNYLREKCSLVWLTQILVMKPTVFANLLELRSPWISTTSPVMHIKLLTMDGTIRPAISTTRTTSHAAVFLAALFVGSSVGMSSNNQTSQQQ